MKRSVEQIFDDSEHKNTIELADKLDLVCHGYEANAVKDALLTLFTWFIADCVPKTEHDEYIANTCLSLKESVKMQMLANAKTSDKPS